MRMTDPMVMAAPFQVVAAPVAGLLANMAVLMAIRNLSPHGHYLRAVVLAYGVGALLQAVFTVWGSLSASHDVIGGASMLAFLVHNMMAFSALAFGFFVFVNLGATSLRIRMLRILSRKPEGRASLSDIAHIYDPQHLSQVRLQRLIAWGQLRVEGERVFTRPKGTFDRLGKSIALLRVMVYPLTYRLERWPASDDGESNKWEQKS